jgi:O-antigen ligase
MLGLALAVLTIQALVFGRGFTSTPLYRLYESVLSIGDYRSSRTYEADLGDKPDNNQFRLVWWRAVVDETWSDGRWLGLGYGHDLAGEFVRIYYADAAEDFSARSPHNFLLTVFGRMGLVGFSGFAMIIFLIARRTWRAGQYARANPEESEPLLLWLTGWMILSSACFGVVLEGPMGAMVFWTSLGLANARMVAVRARATEPAPVAESSEALPAPASDVRPGLHDSAGALL